MKKSILFSVLVVGATLLQAQSITVHQTCGQNGQVVKAIPPEAAQAVDLGLSVKWANMNVGAESPEDYGDYFAWGETATKETYNWDNYFDAKDGGNTFTKYNNEGGKTVLDPEDDAAHVNWGGSWHMPTKAEWQELIDNCTWTWTTQNGINGYKVTSNKAGYTDKFIFLPAAGYRYDSDLSNVGSYGCYWPSSLYEDYPYDAGFLWFYSDFHDLRYTYRTLGLSVRPVSFSAMANDTIRIYSNGCDDYQTFIGSHGSQLTMTANSDQWSHFVRWNDGNTDNPRTITTNGNADYTAYFETYKYSVQVQSSDAAKGRAYIYKVVKGDTIEYNDSVGTFEAGSEVYLTCQANYGYHFVQWNIEQYHEHIVTGPLHIVKFSVPETWSNPYAWVWETGFYGYWTTLSKEDDLYVYKTTLSDMNIIVVPNGPDWANGQTNDLAITESCCYTISGENIYRYDATQHYDCFSTEEQAKIDQVDTMIYIDTTITYATANPLSLLLTQNQKAIAYFAKNIYSITKNAEHGNISGNSSAEYLDEVTLTAVPDYGYHFTQWSDGNTDNPRIFQITSDTTFTAEFAYDRVGTCGKDLALVWSYDPTNKVLTIGNAGSFTENMQFGVEAPNEMEELVIGNSVTAIGANAFAGIETLKKVSIGESVKTIGEQAFYNCVNLETIFNYRPTPTNTYSNAFDGVDKFECTLYVLPSSIDMYKAAAVWRDFYYTYAIGAEEATVTTNDVQVEPQDNAVVVTWPVNNEAASYTIEITKDGEVFCRLVFNANGQLTGIAFAPSPNGTPRHAPTALMTANGMQFTVTGLNSGTNYGYSVTTKDANDQPIASYSGEFSTTGEVPTSVDQVPSDQVQCTKILRNGQIFILRGEKTYTVTGQETK